MTACSGNNNNTIISVTVSCSPSSIFSNQTSQCSASVKGTGSFNLLLFGSNHRKRQPFWRVFAAIGELSDPSDDHRRIRTGLDKVRLHNDHRKSTLDNYVSDGQLLAFTIQSGQTSQCVSTVQGTGSFNTSVSWTASSGTITTSGLTLARLRRSYAGGHHSNIAARPYEAGTA